MSAAFDFKVVCQEAVDLVVASGASQQDLAPAMAPFVVGSARGPRRN